ncbi:hypothetical protein [Streptomyces lydicus]|uniref:hypothetical protein n=1 Tax=Streptomyces lydicus TaxID=47763 RepID=UPI001013B6BE|nr:hypothetical protein [Streptomyces lydicus]
MADDNEEFWAEERARAAAERGRQADPSACGTCRGRVEAGQQVKHDECAQRATLLQAPDHPGYELITGLTKQELAALPARFHVPAFIDTCTPKAWVCAVCWGDGWCTRWPCATALEHGTQVFSPEHDAEQHQKQQAAELARLRAELERYVGAEPTVAEEMQYLNRCLDAVHDVLDEARRGAERWETPLPVPEWVTVVARAANGGRPTRRPSRVEVLREAADRFEAECPDAGGSMDLCMCHAAEPLRRMADDTGKDTAVSETDYLSRFSATPAEVHRFLASRTAEDVHLRYQQAVGSHAVEQAAKHLRMAAACQQAAGEITSPREYRAAADDIDPMKRGSGGPFPAELIRFGTTGGASDA